MLLRFHTAHILQVCSRHTADLDAGVPARGLNGEAYRGHVFWDELFIFPFFNFERPSLAAALLQYRYERLDTARAAGPGGYRLKIADDIDMLQLEALVLSPEDLAGGF